ncbi:hypothetical protein M3M35_07210 [Fructilactobacillus myrtifloralis]|uniref:Cyclic nucleotide-binding domain-containing protein n=1 Tax=Fructilactobacillus myrtifloralis TaxID=2940301 RepID=A0ABY5BND2_9LACO|nr:hypothetical protein [Fructilactobacillus myrtifloralis]USS85070.1 hypothetical protein M3M35_07210 [Fructilactobacillus myrtifloralis]
MEELKGLIVTQNKNAAQSLAKELYMALLKVNPVGRSELNDVSLSNDTISFVSNLASHPIKYTYYFLSIMSAFPDGMDFSSFIITSGTLMKAPEDKLLNCITRIKRTIIHDADAFGPLTMLLPGFPR